ncbi:hypothetical protein Tco_0722365 [Tanacetum coccineum]
MLSQLCLGDDQDSEHDDDDDIDVENDDQDKDDDADDKDEDERMSDAEVTGSDKGDEEVSDAAKADA